MDYPSVRNAGAATITITTPSMKNIGSSSFVAASSPFRIARFFHWLNAFSISVSRCRRISRPPMLTPLSSRETSLT